MLLCDSIDRSKFGVKDGQFGHLFLYLHKKLINHVCNFGFSITINSYITYDVRKKKSRHFSYKWQKRRWIKGMLTEDAIAVRRSARQLEVIRNYWIGCRNFFDRFWSVRSCFTRGKQKESIQNLDLLCRRNILPVAGNKMPKRSDTFFKWKSSK